MRASLSAFNLAKASLEDFLKRTWRTALGFNFALEEETGEGDLMATLADTGKTLGQVWG